jgi:hypothetical protein
MIGAKSTLEQGEDDRDLNGEREEPGLPRDRADLSRFKQNLVPTYSVDQRAKGQTDEIFEQAAATSTMLRFVGEITRSVHHTDQTLNGRKKKHESSELTGAEMSSSLRYMEQTDERAEGERAETELPVLLGSPGLLASLSFASKQALSSF